MWSTNAYNLLGGVADAPGRCNLATRPQIWLGPKGNSSLLQFPNVGILRDVVVTGDRGRLVGSGSRSRRLGALGGSGGDLGLLLLGGLGLGLSGRVLDRCSGHCESGRASSVTARRERGYGVG